VSIEMCFPNLPNAGANYRQTRDWEKIGQLPVGRPYDRNPNSRPGRTRMIDRGVARKAEPTGKRAFSVQPFLWSRNPPQGRYHSMQPVSKKEIPV
jgi:hypothetical protein